MQTGAEKSAPFCIVNVLDLRARGFFASVKGDSGRMGSCQFFFFNSASSSAMRSRNGATAAPTSAAV